MRYDRWGDPIDEDEPTAYNPTYKPAADAAFPQVSPGVHDCDHGWLGEDHHGRPIPCLVCRPHLRRGDL